MNRIKQIINSPIIYMGNKYKLLDRIIPLFPNKEIFLDMFTGGGSVYINISHLYKEVYANDLIDDLVKIHIRLRDDFDNFICKVKSYSIPTKESKEAYLNLRESYNNDKNEEKLYALILSCNSNMMRFNRNFQFNQTWGKRCFNNKTQLKLDKYKERDYSNVHFLSKNFFDVSLKRIRDTFVYLDPPYSNTEAGYNVFWSEDDDKKLISLINFYIEKNIFFGLSGVLNNKNNKIYEYFKNKDLKFYYFEDLYKKISKKDKQNVEYYMTNSIA